MSQPDLTDFEVTPAIVLDAGASCLTAQNHVDETLASLQTYVASLPGVYRGAAASDLQILMGRYHERSTRLSTILGEIGTNLNNNANIYIDVETGADTNILTLHASLG